MSRATHRVRPNQKLKHRLRKPVKIQHPKAKRK